MESKKRSIAKSLSWRFFATFITSAVAFGITGKWTFALEIGLLDTSIKLLVYYWHERLWLRIKFGQEERKSDYQI
jgi:uncharacterized membrane protein